MLFLLSVLYIPEVEKVFRGIENFFRIGYTRASSDMGEVLFCGAGRSSERTREQSSERYTGGTATSKVQQQYLFQADIAGVSGLEKGSHSRRLQHG